MVPHTVGSPVVSKTTRCNPILAVIEYFWLRVSLSRLPLSCVVFLVWPLQARPQPRPCPAPCHVQSYLFLYTAVGKEAENGRMGRGRLSSSRRTARSRGLCPTVGTTSRPARFRTSLVCRFTSASLTVMVVVSGAHSRFRSPLRPPRPSHPLSSPARRAALMRRQLDRSPTSVRRSPEYQLSPFDNNLFRAALLRPLIMCTGPESPSVFQIPNQNSNILTISDEHFGCIDGVKKLSISGSRVDIGSHFSFSTSLKSGCKSCPCT